MPPSPDHLTSTQRLRPAQLMMTILAAVALFAALATPVGAKPKDKDPESTTTAIAPNLAEAADLIGATDLWADGITGEGIDVAIIDTGVAPVPGLDGDDKIRAVVDFSSEASDPDTMFLDTNGHGTHMAGIIAGDDQDSGFAGIAPGAGIVAVKVADRGGVADIPSVIAAIDWVVANRSTDDLNIRVLNLSFGTERVPSGDADPLQAAVERAWEAGIVVVVATGNDGRPEKGLSNPAQSPWVIAVGAAERDDDELRAAKFSTSGDGQRNPDVIAPGVSIESAWVPGSALDVAFPGAQTSGDLFRGSGSSQAAAIASGAVALLLDASPQLSPDQVKALLIATTEDAKGNRKFVGNGLLDIAAAVDAPTPGAEATQDWPINDVGTFDAAPAGQAEGDGASWYGASWYGASWYGASWYGASWYGASWYGASWYGASWYGASWYGASWYGASWYGASWYGASWYGASWYGASWYSSDWA